LNKVKEKKLNAIKSDILEIKDFVISNSHNNAKELLVDADTVTLTKIVDVENNGSNPNVLVNIKQDLNLLKSTLIEHERILKEILFKIK
jgi:iron-sulfur cluster repair protein YtfE (RIC family)